jgi:hypothetical protein
MTSAPLNFIHANRRNAIHISVFQLPIDHIFNRMKHFFPARPEPLRHFFPGSFPCPISQIQHIGITQMVLTSGPGYGLSHHTTITALNSTFGVNQVYLKTPKRNKLITFRRQSVIAWARLATTGAVSPCVFSRHNAHFDLVMVLAYKTGIPIKKSFLSITPIQYCNEFH